MKPYTKSDIARIHSEIIQCAHYNFDKGRFETSLKWIEAAANWSYNFNMIYTNDEVEQLTKKIADRNVIKVQIETPIANRCVLIDSFLLDNRGLSQQYLRAMIANNLEILVIYTNAGGSIGEDILTEIGNYPKANIISFPRGISYIKEVKQIVSSIESFSPANIFLHLTPWDVVALMACHAVKGLNKYNINLTDHAYWMGASFIDYNLEFRPYGMTVSLEMRGLKPEQLLALPYYPISPLFSEFLGFPDIPADAIIVFSGGSLYKMLGKNDIYFRILELVLSLSSKVYILIAGFNRNSTFDEKISKIKGKERVKQIGIRRDIDAVFENSDIYLGTYPMMGGLMSQYAAIHGKPIIAYHEEGDIMNAVEEMVNFHQSNFKSYTNLDKMASYARKLIEDKGFRYKEGKILQEGMMTPEKFKLEMVQLLKTKVSNINWVRDKIDYEAFFERYLELENFSYNSTKSLVRKMKWGAVIYIKTCRANMIEQFVILFLDKIKRYFKYPPKH